MGYSIGPEVYDTVGKPHHVEISGNQICIWERQESAGLFFTYAEALKLANSIRLHLEVYTEMELD